MKDRENKQNLVTSPISQDWKGPLELCPKENPSFTRKTEEEAPKNIKKTATEREDYGNTKLSFQANENRQTNNQNKFIFMIASSNLL